MLTLKLLSCRAVSSWTFSNVIAGSDSVSTVMTTTMFNLLAHPYAMETLYKELGAANLSRPYPKHSEVRDLPYLEACIQESVRFHPPFALPLERIVPKGGVTVLGHYLPAGTVVGGNPYVVNRHKPTFGADADNWRPERWLEIDDTHKKRWEQSMLTVSPSFLHFCPLPKARVSFAVAESIPSSLALAGVSVSGNMLESSK